MYKYLMTSEIDGHTDCNILFSVIYPFKAYSTQDLFYPIKSHPIRGGIKQLDSCNIPKLCERLKETPHNTNQITDQQNQPTN